MSAFADAPRLEGRLGVALRDNVGRRLSRQAGSDQAFMSQHPTVRVTDPVQPDPDGTSG